MRSVKEENKASKHSKKSTSRTMKTYRRIFKSLPTSSQTLVEEAIAPSRSREPNTGFQPASAPRPPRKRRLFPSRPTKLAATGIALGLIATSQAVVVSTASVDFLGNFQSGALVASDIAGVVPTNQWGAATGNTGFLSQPDTSASDLIDFFWIAPTSSVIGGSTPTPGDNLMMEGYIASQSTTAGVVPASVRVTSIDLGALGWSYYDVFVYSDTGTNGPTTQINLSSPATTSYFHNEFVPGFGVGGFNTYIDSQASPPGNYVRFNGLTANMFNVETFHIPGVSDISAINGIEIVGHKIPEPSTSFMTLLSTGLLLLRRKRS